MTINFPENQICTIEGAPQFREESACQRFAAPWRRPWFAICAISLRSLTAKRRCCFPGVFCHFLAMANVTCLSEALEAVKDTLPTWRGQNEQSMGAGRDWLRQSQAPPPDHGRHLLDRPRRTEHDHCRRRCPFQPPCRSCCSAAIHSSIAAPIRSCNRSSTSVTLRSTSMMPSAPVTRYWDRLTHPEQIISSLPQAVAVLLDPADCGPGFHRAAAGTCRKSPGIIRKPFSKPTVHAIFPRQRAPTRIVLAQALEILKSAKRPLIISGGGVRYSGAEDVLGAFCDRARHFRLPKPSRAKGALTHHHPAHIGPIGIVGSTSANALAAEADVIFGDRKPA